MICWYSHSQVCSRSSVKAVLSRCNCSQDSCMCSPPLRCRFFNATKQFLNLFVGQQRGDSEIHLNMSMAFPVATVATYLMCEIPELSTVRLLFIYLFDFMQFCIFQCHVYLSSCAQLLVARFNVSCPYTVPCYPRKQTNQSEEDYLLALGYIKKKAGFETEEAFMERMAGFLSLFVAIIQTDPPPGKPIIYFSLLSGTRTRSS